METVRNWHSALTPTEYIESLRTLNFEEPVRFDPDPPNGIYARQLREYRFAPTIDEWLEIVKYRQLEELGCEYFEW